MPFLAIAQRSLSLARATATAPFAICKTELVLVLMGQLASIATRFPTTRLNLLATTTAHIATVTALA